MKQRLLLAGAGGIEPTLPVLETGVLPLNDAPILFDCDGRVAGTLNYFNPRVLCEAWEEVFFDIGDRDSHVAQHRGVRDDHGMWA